MSKGKLLVISGPSGVGKGTLVKRILSLRPQTTVSVSCTTRSPREGEKEGESYFFISQERFKQLIEEGGLLEYDSHFGNYYGTPKAFVEEKLKTGDVILEIEVNGGLTVKKSMPDAVLVMVVPPDMDTLYSRLHGRGTESEEAIADRMARIEYEYSKAKLYDYTVVNDNLDDAVAQIIDILEK